MKKCGDCDKLDRERCYPTAPPKYDCKITGQCHRLDDVCDVKEEMDKQNGFVMDINVPGKPLSEWTLGEAQAFCRERVKSRDWGEFGKECEDCLLNGVCALPVEEWNRSRLTEHEIATMRVFGGRWVSRDAFDEADVMLWADKPEFNEGVYSPSKIGSGLASCRAKFFPSVHPGECIRLEEAK